MKTRTKYISDSNHFIIENGRLTGFEYTDKLEELQKFLTEYLNEQNKDKALTCKGKVAGNIRFSIVDTAIGEKSIELSEPEKLFLSIIEDGKWEGDYYLNKEGNKIIYKGEKKVVWVDYYRFWSKFSNQFGMKHEEIQDFMKYQLLKNLKIEGKIPDFCMLDALATC
jgi:hypothetical protein